MKIKKICWQCGKEIKPAYRLAVKGWKKRRFCNEQCFRLNQNSNYYPGQRTVECAYCQKLLFRWNCELQLSKLSFCNASCQMNYYKKAIEKNPRLSISFNHPSAIIHRYKKGMRPSIVTEFHEGLIPWNKGKAHSCGQKEKYEEDGYLEAYFSGLWKRSSGTYPRTPMEKKLIRNDILKFKILRSWKNDKAGLSQLQQHRRQGKGATQRRGRQNS